jgi:putative heme-binding domain-containing protein
LSSKALVLLVDSLNRCDASAAEGLMQGMQEGLAGRRIDAIPDSWPKTFERLQSLGSAPKRMAWQLGAAMNDPHSLEELQRVACDRQREADERRASIELLCQKRFKPFEEALLQLAEDASVRSTAIRGLAAFDHPQTATKLLSMYDKLSAEERQIAQSTLAAKARWAGTLLDYLAKQPANETDQLTAYTARQIKSLSDAELNEKLRCVWGEVRDSSGDISKRVTAIRRWLTPANLAQADQERGHQLFKKHCANCHTFFGEGGKIGPDITGSQRMNIDYLLETILDPNATVAKDYQMTILRTTDDRVLNGLIESQNEETIVMQTATERVVLDRADVAEMRPTQNSIMPLGLLDSLSETETRDLISYLQRAP